MTVPGTWSPAAKRYLAFLESAAQPLLNEPELFPAVIPPLEELEWQSRWFSGDFGREFTTVDGQAVRVLDFGWWNHSAGPDFQDCVVEINGTAQRGSIELDPCLHDWDTHGHAVNPAYDGTVLHLFLSTRGGGFFTRTSAHRSVPQVQLDVRNCDPDAPRGHAPARPGRCVRTLAALRPEQLHALMEDAARYRLERKGRRWRRIAGIHGEDQTLYQGIAEALGYSRNKLPMSVLAQRLPLKFLRKREDDAEALLFGVAGFLDGREAGHGDEATRTWLRRLWESWWKYRADYAPGEPVRPICWTLSGSRPVNHPQRRIAALWQIVEHWKDLRRLMEPASFHAKTFTARLESLEHAYWSRHYTLRAKPSAAPLALLGAQRIRDIMANLVYPLLVPEREALWNDYTKLPAPEDSTRGDIAAIRLFGSERAADPHRRKLWQQQALLQIYEDFCLSGTGGCETCCFPAQAAG
jgi:Protein of unknown function (DUF2851)